MINNNLVVYKTLLVVLISSLAITGIGFLDNQIWNTIMLIICIIVYAVVGSLFSVGIICGTKRGERSLCSCFHYYFANWILYLQRNCKNSTMGFFLDIICKNTGSNYSQFINNMYYNNFNC